jgi:hypothetical protein
MKPNRLLPHKLKKLGWLLFIPSGIIGLIIISTNYEVKWLNTYVFAIFNDELFSESRYFSIIKMNITQTLFGTLFIFGGLLVGFSEEKVEDEYISGLRLQALLWSVALNYLLLLFAFLFIYGTSFLQVMIYNMFTILVLFIGRFHFLLYKNKKTYSDEK